MADLLEQLWTDVINIDVEREWISRVGKTPSTIAEHYRNCAPAFERLRKICAAKDLGQVSRFIRYETVFEIVYAIEDTVPPGTSLAAEPLIEAAFSEKKPSRKLAEFIERLRETLDPDDDGEWMLGLIDQKSPFLKDTGAAVKRLIKAGAATGDLGQLAVWSTYEAVEWTLRLMSEAKLTIPDDTDGLHELLMGADPSGEEGGPGSWPVAVSSGKSKTRTSAGKNKDEPLWRVRSGQAVAFSPDSKLLAIGSASGPARIVDAHTGRERLICEGIKAHIYRVVFAPDGKRLAVADINKRVDICDVGSGRLLAKVTFPEEEICGLAYNQLTGDLVRGAWTKTIGVIDGVTGKKKEPLLVDAKANMVEAIAFSADGKRLLATWTSAAAEAGQVSVWSWPDQTVIRSFKVNHHSVSDVAWSKEGLLAVSARKAYDNKEPGIRIFDTNIGKEVFQVPAEEPGDLCFLPDGTLVVCEGESLRFLESKTWKPIREIEDAGEIYELTASPDGKLLAAAGSGVRVWAL